MDKIIHLRYTQLLIIAAVSIGYVLIEYNAVGLLTRSLVGEIVALVIPSVILWVYYPKEAIGAGFYIPTMVVIPFLILWSYTGSDSEFPIVGINLIAGIAISSLFCLYRDLDKDLSEVVGVIISAIVICMVGYNDIIGENYIILALVWVIAGSISSLLFSRA